MIDPRIPRRPCGGSGSGHRVDDPQGAKRQGMAELGRERGLGADPDRPVGTRGPGPARRRLAAPARRFRDPIQPLSERRGRGAGTAAPRFGPRGLRPDEPRRTRRHLRHAGPHRRLRRERRRRVAGPRLPGLGRGRPIRIPASSPAWSCASFPQTGFRSPRRGDLARGQSMSVRIAPSILSADFAALGTAVAAAEAGGADMIHVDVMDGHFVPNLTIGPPVVAALHRVATVPLDVHLMIADPDRYVDRFAEAGAAGISVHVEAAPHLHRTLGRIRSHGIRAGVVLNPATAVSDPERGGGRRRLRAVMTVNPGFRRPDVHPRQRREDRTGPATARRGGQSRARRGRRRDRLRQRGAHRGRGGGDSRGRGGRLRRPRRPGGGAGAALRRQRDGAGGPGRLTRWLGNRQRYGLDMPRPTACRWRTIRTTSSGSRWRGASCCARPAAPIGIWKRPASCCR